MVLHVPMRIPILGAVRTCIDQLNEPYPALGQSTRNQTLPPESLGLSCLQPVHLERRLRLARKIKCLRSLSLHPKSGLETPHPRLQHRIQWTRFDAPSIELAEQLQLQRLLSRTADPRPEMFQRLITWNHMRPLMAPREKIAPPSLRPRIRSLRGQDHKRWQILVDCP